MSTFLDSKIITKPLDLLTSLLSPQGKRARLSILIYHRVLTAPDPLTGNVNDIDYFDKQMRYISQHFNVLPLAEAAQRLSSGSLPARAACITFDDGYADNVEAALPILQKHGVSATFFIATSFLNGGIMWNDKLIETIRRIPGDVLDLEQLGLGKHPIKTIQQRRTALSNLIPKFKYFSFEERQKKLEQLQQITAISLPNNLMMTSDQVRQLHQSGMEIGAHTVEHPILTRITDEQAHAEMLNSKTALEAMIESPVRLFSYPNGKPNTDYLHTHTRMAKEIGFEAAVSTASGTATNQTDLFQLPRFTPWDIERHRFIAHMAKNMLTNPAMA